VVTLLNLDMFLIAWHLEHLLVSLGNSPLNPLHSLHIWRLLWGPFSKQSSDKIFLQRLQGLVLLP
jgi:hypothetical protein